MVLRNVAKIVVAFGEAVGKAFSRAVREEYAASRNAAQNQSSSTSSKSTSSAEDATRTNAKLGISLQESLQILDVKQPLEKARIEERYKHLFHINDKANGGTLYLQSKVFRAKERIDSELARVEDEEKEKSARDQSV